MLIFLTVLLLHLCCTWSELQSLVCALWVLSQQQTEVVCKNNLSIVSCGVGHHWPDEKIKLQCPQPNLCSISSWYYWKREKSPGLEEACKRMVSMKGRGNTRPENRFWSSRDFLICEVINYSNLPWGFINPKKIEKEGVLQLLLFKNQYVKVIKIKYRWSFFFTFVAPLKYW